MGCDGGTIPRRDELVKLKKKPEQKDKDAELAFRWRHCVISQEPLQTPIVACGMGYLYSKTTAIEGLLNRAKLPQCCKHIKSLKDIKDLNLTPNPGFIAVDKKGDSADTGTAPYICPVIGLEMSGKFRFVFLWSCGCVFSERALKEVKTTICHKCQAPFSEEDVVVLNGNEDDLALMKVRMEARQIKQKAQKKNKNKVEVKTESAEVGPSTSNGAPNPAIAAQIKSENPNAGKTTKINSTTNDDSNKTVFKNGLKRAGAINPKNDAETKKMKAGYSVAKDPKATDVYKSLFTSHKSEQEQSRAHWVTYNPFYN